jgi:predicted transcriptional regulator
MTTTLEPDTIEEDAQVSTDLAVIEDNAELAPLTEGKARQLDKRIRTTGTKLDDTADTFVSLLQDAAIGQIHVPLGLKSWTVYVADVAKDNKFLQMVAKDRIERKALAVAMSEHGMSQSQIGAALGWSQKTIDRDLEGVEFDSDTITSSDNRTMPRNAPRDDDNTIDAEVVDDEPPAKPASVTDDFETEVFNLQLAITEMKEIIGEDDRFPKQRKKIQAKYLNSLQEVKTELETIIDEVFGS